MKVSKKTQENLTDIIWENVHEEQGGKVSFERLTAVSNALGKILLAKKLQMQYNHFRKNENYPKIDFFENN
jgi:hypothetical protein